MEQKLVFFKPKTCLKVLNIKHLEVRLINKGVDTGIKGKPSVIVGLVFSDE